MSAYLYALIDTLGWTLLHSLWEIAAITSLVAALSALSRDVETRYLIHSLGLAAAALAPVITFLILWPAEVGGATVAGTAVVSLTSVVDAASAEAWRPELRDLLPLAVLAWIIGVSIKGSKVILAWRRTTLLLEASGRPAPPELAAVFERLVERMALGVRATLMLSERVEVPSVIGWLRPIVLMPPAVLAGLTPQQVELILAHEIAHIRRHDYLVNLLQVVLETLIFYHPGVRWMSRRMRELREECCDDLVVDQSGEPLAYARALTELEGLRQQHGVVCMAATGGQLMRRIQRIALPHQQRGSSVWATGLLISTTAAAVTMGGDLLLDNVAPEATRATARQVTSYAPMASGPSLQLGLDSVAPLVLPETEAPASRGQGRTDPDPIPARPLTDAPLALDLSTMAAQIAETTETAGPSVATSSSTQGPAHDGPVIRMQAAVAEGGEAIAMAAPVYPESQRRRGHGTVIDVEFTVLPDGSVADVHFPYLSVEDRPFRDAVETAVSSWRFVPYRLYGEVIAQPVAHRVVFSVEETDQRSCRRMTGSRVCRDRGAQPREFGVSVIRVGD